MNIHFKQFFFALVLVSVMWAGSSFAQSPGVVIGNNVSVHETANPKSEILIQLEKGKKLNVLQKRGNWLQVKVALDKSFTFTGWVDEKQIKWKGGASQVARNTRAPSPPPPPVPTSPPAPVQQVLPSIPPTPTPPPVAPKTELDKFFAPAGEVAPQGGEPKAQISKPVYVAGPPRSYGINSKTRVSAGLGYILYHYSLSSGGGSKPGSVFAYNLPGLGINLEGSYQVWEAMDGNLKTHLILNYQHGLLQNQTDLQDFTGLTFGTVTSKHMSYRAQLRAPLEYRFGSNENPVVAALSAGMEFWKFAADDVASDTAPLNLYVSQQTIAGMVGASANFKIPRLPDFFGTVGFDVIAYTKATESPSDVTGTGIKGKMGFAPHLLVTWKPRDQHHFDLGYDVRIQSFTMSGTASRAGTSNVVDGSLDTAFHTFFLRYDYLF